MLSNFMYLVVIGKNCMLAAWGAGAPPGYAYDATKTNFPGK